MPKTDKKKWQRAAGIRALKTTIQTAIATAGTDAAFSEVNQKGVFITALLAGLLSLVTSLGGLPEVVEEEKIEELEEEESED